MRHGDKVVALIQNILAAKLQRLWNVDMPVMFSDYFAVIMRSNKRKPFKEGTVGS